MPSQFFGLFFLCLAMLETPAYSEDIYALGDVRQVKVQGVIGDRISNTIKYNVLKIDVEKDFVQPYRDRNQETGFIGGGMFLDSLVRLAAYSGNDELLHLKRRTIRELIKTQEADGYLGILIPEARIWELWDVHEMAYLVLGLSADYQYFGERDSLDAACKIADYLIDRLGKEPDRKLTRGTRVDHLSMIGLGSALITLHQHTGETRYINFCTDNLKLHQWNYPIEVGRWGKIGGHSYAYISRCLEQLKLHRLQPNERLLNPSREALDFLLNRDGLVITGAMGSYECWDDSQAGSHNLGETCATAYFVRWLDDLLRLQGKPVYGDLMERAIYNALFAAQSPDGRQLRYYSPFSGPRVYFDLDSYCCPCNFRRIISELPSMIYYSNGQEIMVNLYTASTATIALEQGVEVTLEQKTNYPASGDVRLIVSPSQPKEFSIQLRVPSWCSEAMVSLNGGEPESVASGLHTMKRIWKQGDQIDLTMPMSWRLIKGRESQSGRVAVARGPLVYCLDSSQNELLKQTDLNLLTIDTASLQDSMGRDGTMECSLHAWSPEAWYPESEASLKLGLKPFTDPNGVNVYFRVPNPQGAELIDDEFLGLEIE